MKLITPKYLVLISALALSFAVSARAEGTKPTKVQPAAGAAAEGTKPTKVQPAAGAAAETAAMKADKAKHKAAHEAKEKPAQAPKKS